MSTPQGQSSEDKKKKKKARSALLLFLNRLREACKTFQMPAQWCEFVKQLEPLLQEFEKQIPAANLQRMKAAMQLPDVSREPIKRACRVLQYEVEKTIQVLPAGGALAPVLAGGLIVVAVAIAAVIAYVDLTAVKIGIVNDGCSPIQLPASLPIPIPGLDLPSLPIPSGGSATAKVPRMTVKVEATERGRVAVTVMGMTMPFDLGGGVTSVRLDGVSILGQSTTVNLGKQKQHQLVISCR